MRGHSGSVWDVGLQPRRAGRRLRGGGWDGQALGSHAARHAAVARPDRPSDPADRGQRETAASWPSCTKTVRSRSGTQRRIAASARLPARTTRSSLFALSGDGNFLAVRVGWRIVRVIRTVDGAVVRDILSPPFAELAPALSHDGSFVAIAQMNQIVTVWDVARARADRTDRATRGGTAAARPRARGRSAGRRDRLRSRRGRPRRPVATRPGAAARSSLRPAAGSPCRLEAISWPPSVTPAS